MSHLLDTPLTLDSPTEKWHEAMESSVRLAKLVERGRFLPEDYSRRDQASGEAAARRITSYEAGCERAEWRENPRSRDVKRRMFQSLEGEGGELDDLMAVAYLNEAFQDLIKGKTEADANDPFLNRAIAEWSTFSPVQKTAAVLSAWDYRETQRMRSYDLAHQHVPSLTAKQARLAGVTQEQLRARWASGGEE